MNERPGEMDERDVDERFASIVAAWDGALPSADDPEVDETPTARDAAPAQDDPDEPAASTPTPPATRPPWVNPPVDVVVPASAWRAAEPAPEPAVEAAAEDPDDDEHYDPPAVELPPQEDLHFWGAVVGLVAGPLCLLYVALARPFHSTRWFVAGLVLSLAGFALLVLRQPRHRDDSDDGARV